MATCKGKPVLYLDSRANIEDEAALSGVWRGRTYSSSSREVYILSPIDAIKNKIKSSKGSLKQGDTCYFGKSSEFPRFKLQDSGFKRCIKIEKANCVVIGDLKGWEYNDYTFLEDELNIYCVYAAYTSYIRCNNKAKKAEWDNDWFQYMVNHKLFYGNELHKIYSGKYTCFSKDTGDDVENIMNGTYTNLITDEELDHAVNQNFDLITEEDITSICEMLDSPDTSTQGLGLKMLSGYNVQATPLTIRTMLGIRPHLARLSEWKSVGVQQVISSIELTSFGNFPTNIYHLLQPGKLHDYTDYDKSLCKHLYLIAIRQVMDKAIKTMDDTGVLSIFGLNVAYEIT